MPRYDYQCDTKNCEGEETFVIEHSIKEPAKEQCPFCGKNSLTRLISGSTSFKLKGNSWAKNGYS